MPVVKDLEWQLRESIAWYSRQIRLEWKDRSLTYFVLNCFELMKMLFYLVPLFYETWDNSKVMIHATYLDLSESIFAVCVSNKMQTNLIFSKV